MLESGLKEIYSEEAVTEAIFTMSQELSSKIELAENTVFIMLLKGGVYTGMRLLRYLDIGIFYGFLGFNSYYGEQTISSGLVRCTYKPIFEPDFLRGKDIWVIDDVVQTGATLVQARRMLEQMKPKSIRYCVLVDKCGLTSIVVQPHIVGFRYKGEKFIVGCGLGLGERYRNLQCICEVKG